MIRVLESEQDAQFARLLRPGEIGGGGHPEQPIGIVGDERSPAGEQLYGGLEPIGTLRRVSEVEDIHTTVTVGVEITVSKAAGVSAIP